MVTPQTLTELWEFPHAAPVPRNGKTLIMGIVNMTPDSFSGRNAAPTPREAADLALKMIADGADMVDIGAESSRPGAGVLTADEELARLGDAVAILRAETAVPISVDTYHPETAVTVLRQGADIINDIAALRCGWDEGGERRADMARAIADYGAHAVLMHMPAAPDRMQEKTIYADIVAEVREFLLERADFAERQGIARERVWLDPGFGFGKDFLGNRELLVRLPVFRETGYPLLVGLSRKRMVDDILHLPPAERLEGSLALAVIAAMKGANIIRTHDPLPTSRAVAVADAVAAGGV
jgi:dihydropteroate synthase